MTVFWMIFNLGFAVYDFYMAYDHFIKQDPLWWSATFVFLGLIMFSFAILNIIQISKDDN